MSSSGVPKMTKSNPIWDTHSPLWDTKNPFIITKPSDKPTVRKPCPKAVRDAVWRKYFGDKMTGKCYVCGKPITFTDFEVGHNKPFIKGGEWNVNNLRPICRTCNRSMGTMTIEEFKKRFFR